MDDFYKDVWQGLNASPKYLHSKYFYDEAGDAIFRQIMDCPEYYLTRCEKEILSTRSEEMVYAILDNLTQFDVAELGPGDASKTIFFLDTLLKRKVEFDYYPIDISRNVIIQLENGLPAKRPGLRVKGLNGEYFEMLGQLRNLSAKNKVVLFLGSNIGNMLPEEAAGFLVKLKTYLLPGDLLLIGFDLKKDPDIVLAAYNDTGGITKQFNLNLLRRINETLAADFDTNQFDHCPTYDNISGACKSFLLSRKDQTVHFHNSGEIRLKKGEPIYMEISQKYTVQEIDQLAGKSGFHLVKRFYDSRSWFVDDLWISR